MAEKTMTAAMARRLAGEILEAKRATANKKLEEEQMDMAIKAIQQSVDLGMFHAVVPTPSRKVLDMLAVLGYGYTVQAPSIGDATGSRTKISW